MLGTVPSGSSPLARGTLANPAPGADVLRFIPAGAGNAPIAAEVTFARMVHPRWRGEREAVDCSAFALAGSSPLARGTPRARELIL